MAWKERLRELEAQKLWDEAINFMEQVIKDNPDDVDTYIYIIFLLMNILVEEMFDISKHDYYAFLLREYFDLSYAKFSNNARYLFCVGITVAMAEWYVDLDVKDYKDMLHKALELEPNNLMYQSGYYLGLDRSVPANRRDVLEYARLICSNDTQLLQAFLDTGACGVRWLRCMRSWSKEVLADSSS
jgi:tetratricopeptide (TPR) repeat protein